MESGEWLGIVFTCVFGISAMIIGMKAGLFSGRRVMWGSMAVLELGAYSILKNAVGLPDTGVSSVIRVLIMIPIILSFCMAFFTRHQSTDCQEENEEEGTKSKTEENC